MKIWIPALVCVVGLLIYFGSKTNVKLQHVGDVMFWTGLLVTLFSVATQVASFLE